MGLAPIRLLPPRRLMYVGAGVLLVIVALVALTVFLLRR